MKKLSLLLISFCILCITSVAYATDDKYADWYDCQRTYDASNKGQKVGFNCDITSLGKIWVGEYFNTNYGREKQQVKRDYMDGGIVRTTIDDQLFVKFSFEDVTAFKKNRLKINGQWVSRRNYFYYDELGTMSFLDARADILKLHPPKSDQER